MADFEVRYTFGVEPLQQYLIETDGGRLQPLTIAWNTRDGKWFHLLPQRKGTARRRAALDRALPDRQHDVHRLPHHRLRQALRRQGRRLRVTLVGSERVLPVLPRPGLEARRVGPAQGRGQSRRHAAGPALRTARRPAHAAGSGRGLCRLPFAPRRTHRHAGAGSAASGPLPAQPAARRPVPRRWPAARRGLRRRLVSSEQDVPHGCELQQLPRPAHRRRPGCRATRCACNATSRRPTRPSPARPATTTRPRITITRSGTPGAQCVGLPHAGEELHGRAAAARPQHARAAPRPVGVASARPTPATSATTTSRRSGQPMR